MNIWILLIIILLVAVAIFAYFGNRESNKAGQEAAILMQQIENKYNDFIERKIMNRILTYSNFDLNQSKIVEEALILLKPDIEGIISHINSTTYSSAKVEFIARYFTNIPPLINEMFIKSTKNPNNRLTKDDENEFYRAIEDSIKSDLLMRSTELKDGEFN